MLFRSNIRNAMTPMINGLDRLRKAFKVADNLRISEATEQAANPECAADRKEKYLAYINASFEHVSSVAEKGTSDLKIVTSQAKQIEAILANLENSAIVALVAENRVIDAVLNAAGYVFLDYAEPNVLLKMGEFLYPVRFLSLRTG